MKTKWIKCSDKMPLDGQKVVAKYVGVYKNRIVNFWIDEGGGTHFGAPNEFDGKGSQPATHWRPIV